MLTGAIYTQIVLMWQFTFFLSVFHFSFHFHFRWNRRLGVFADRTEVFYHLFRYLPHFYAMDSNHFLFGVFCFAHFWFFMCCTLACWLFCACSSAFLHSVAFESDISPTITFFSLCSSLPRFFSSFNRSSLFPCDYFYNFCHASEKCNITGDGVHDP